MNLLAIETATTICSAALWTEGGVAVELTLNRPRAHSENLVSLLSDALRYGGLTAKEVDVVAVSSGPGSYTGLRIGASTAKGIARAIDAALVEVPSLEALAYGSSGALSEGDIIVAAFDARRDEVFGAAFQLTASGALNPLRPSSAVRIDMVKGWLDMPAARVHLVGDAAGKLQTALSGTGLTVSRTADAFAHPRAGSVAVLGAERFMRGETVDLALFEPRYLKQFVAKKSEATAFEKLPF